MKNNILLLILVIVIGCKKESVKTGEVIELTKEEQVNVKKYAPKFSFVSYDGETVSLDDLKGKYLYIDVWATWCRPCLMQLPYMKELQKKYKDTNVQLVSISVDRVSDKTKWESMVDAKDMDWLQLFTGAESRPFSEDYKINTIPYFIIIGKDGEILHENSLSIRPVDYKGELNQELIKLLDKYAAE